MSENSTPLDNDPPSIVREQIAQILIAHHGVDSDEAHQITSKWRVDANNIIADSSSRAVLGVVIFGWSREAAIYPSFFTAAALLFMLLFRMVLRGRGKLVFSDIVIRKHRSRLGQWTYSLTPWQQNVCPACALILTRRMSTAINSLDYCLG
ncbi:uncharacterized protein PAC_01447 [Phialocephala subalpina]|uniref:Uncharacterized protein n=1 Tax=Phialocephala subalpina TaxID=576137 RepID=A0A1L7WFM1_9HELO|nr:uncharacterized protein PAC_01447 [Phialocephala subalpina]